MTDEELLTEYLRTKDNGLFTALYERMHDGLCAVARRIAPKDADDVVQDAFCKLCRLEPQEVNPGFMVKMVQNLAICRSRCRKQKREVSLDVVMRLGLGDEYGRNGRSTRQTQQKRDWRRTSRGMKSRLPLLLCRRSRKRPLNSTIVMAGLSPKRPRSWRLISMPSRPGFVAAGTDCARYLL